MEQVRQLLEKENIRYSYYAKWGVYFRTKWREHFASHLTFEEQEKIFMLPHRYFGTFLWYIFSYERKKFIEGSAANERFNSLRKGKCIIFHQFSEEVIIVEDGNRLRGEWFERFPYDDFYVVDEDFTWSYNITHHSPEYGPYYTEADWTE